MAGRPESYRRRSWRVLRSVDFSRAASRYRTAWGRRGRGRRVAASPASWAATSCAVPAPRITPSDPCPVATCNPSRTAPTSGRSSGVSGRSPHHADCTAASSIAGTRSRAAASRRLTIRPSGGSGVSHIWRVEPITIVRPSRCGCSSAPSSSPGAPSRITTAASGHAGGRVGAQGCVGPGASTRCESRCGTRGATRTSHPRAPMIGRCTPACSSSGDDHGPAATIVVVASIDAVVGDDSRHLLTSQQADRERARDAGSRPLALRPRAPARR